MFIFKHLFLFGILQSLLILTIVAQSPNKPFSMLDIYIEKKQRGWEDSRLELSKLFQKERIRLGSQFESALLTYVGDEERRCYWIALFLDSEAYLNGSPPFPDLAFAIRRRCLQLGPEPLSGKTKELNTGKPDVRTLVRSVSMISFTAVSAAKVGETNLALSLKEKAESILADNPDLREYFPKFSERNRCIYESIGNDVRICSVEIGLDRFEGIIKPSIVNGKLLFVPDLKGQAGLRGTVEINLIVDEQGIVRTAKAFSGPPGLFALAEAAALRARFSPTTFYGRPWAVTSQLIFNFR